MSSRNEKWTSLERCRWGSWAQTPHIYV